MTALPNGWSKAEAGRLFGVVTSGSRGWAEHYSDVGPLFVRIGNMRDQAIDLSLANVQRVQPPSGAEGARTALRPGDILISITAEIGRVAIVPPDLGEAYVNQHIALARPQNGLCNEFLAWQLAGPGRSKLVALRKGATKAGLSLDDIRRVEVHVAPLNEQRRIVAKLDEVFAQTRAAKARLERLPALIDKLKRSILAAAFRGDLTADWRAANPDVEPARELLERVFAARQTDGRRRGATRDDGTASAALPTGWAWTTIGDICDVGTGATPQRGEPRFWMDGHIPWVTSGAANSEFVDAAKEFVTDAALAETNLTLYPAGTLLIAMYGEGQTRGRCAELRVSATTNQALAALRTDQLPSSLKALLKFFLWDRYEALRMHAAGGVQPNLNLSIIRGITVPVPPLAEQAVIIDLLRGALQSVAAITARDLEMGARVGAIERAALAKAFRGELVPQDPADEPAEVLLARLRAAKAEEAPVARRSRAAAPEPTYAAPPITLAQAAESGPLFQHALERRERAAPEPAAQDLVVAALQQSDGRLTAAAIAQTTGLAPAAVRAALKDLIAAGQVHTHGKARGTMYQWLK